MNFCYNRNNVKWLLPFIFLNAANAIRVCRNEYDYFLPFSENCWNISEDILKIAEFIKNIFGFYAEDHQVITEDGYGLSVVRFYRNISKTNSVILGHGTITNGFSFVLLMENSLGFMLAEEGYDVWLINFRGARYSRNHAKYTVDDEAFWNFSFHEIGVLDLSATVDYIYNKTSTKALYIGMSMGTTALTVYSSLKAHEAEEKLLGAVLVAPAGVFVNKNSSLVILDPRRSFLPYLAGYYKGAVFYERSFIRGVIATFSTNPIFIKAILAVVRDIDGYDLSQVDWISIPLGVTEGIDITTHKNLIHYNQCIETGEFKYFDYGKRKNAIKYNQEKPPFYPLNDIKIPIAILASNGDIITPIEGARKLYQQFPSKSQCGFFTVKNNLISHIGMVFSKNVRYDVNQQVLEFLKKIETNSCHL